jgi:hypothetical protein
VQPAVELRTPAPPSVAVDHGSEELAAWFVHAKCEEYAQQLADVEGLKVIDDLLPLLGEPDQAILERLKFMRPADARRFVSSLRSDASIGFSAWLSKIGCIDYKQQLMAMGYRSTDDMYELQGKTDDFIRGKFAFIGAAKKAHLERLVKSIQAIVIE